LVAIGVGIVFPTLLCGLLWGDYRGGFFFASMLRIFFVHHATFFVNSLAHYHGFSTYSDLQSAKDSWITAVLTLGEGYHNYHHEFPSDYRNGIKFYHYDPTKWLIRMLAFLGLAYNLKQYSEADALKASLQTRQRQLMILNANNEYGSNFEALPDMAWTEFRRRCTEEKQQLVVIGEFVHDVSKFVDQHPGGRQTLLNFVGTDSTHYFNGEVGTPQVHNHTKLAHSLLKPLRIANITERPGDPKPHHHHHD
jgi:stearoyl-CoA desaturase (delta-9 desaturase)